MALFGNTILCDNVYVDRESGKPILAGVFSGDIVLPSVPFRMRCSIYCVFMPPQSGAHRIEMKFFLDRKQVASATLEARDTIAGTPALLVVPQLEMGIDKQVRLQVMASANGGRVITLLRKQITVRSPASTLTPPH